jgi:hypothetical protein
VSAAKTNERARNLNLASIPRYRARSGVSLKHDESKTSFAIIRHNVRTYESGGVVAVVKGKENAKNSVLQFESGQSSEDRHAGWRYFLEPTDLRPGMNPEEATNLRQTRLEVRESQAAPDQLPNPNPSRHN